MYIRILLFAAMSLGTAACATSDEAGRDVDPNVPESAEDTEAGTQIQFVTAGAPADRASCQANGPCSSACDDALIIELFVPEGTCVVYDCTLDGGTTRVGGCN
jgi:hypothetical protein